MERTVARQTEEKLKSGQKTAGTIRKVRTEGLQLELLIEVDGDFYRVQEDVTDASFLPAKAETYPGIEHVFDLVGLRVPVTKTSQNTLKLEEFNTMESKDDIQDKLGAPGLGKEYFWEAFQDEKLVIDDDEYVYPDAKEIKLINTLSFSLLFSVLIPPIAAMNLVTLTFFSLLAMESSVLILISAWLFLPIEKYIANVLGLPRHFPDEI